MMAPTVSIITPVYNAADTLGRAVASVQAQREAPDWEMVVCEDGSDDASWAVAKSLAARDERLRLLRMAQNAGAARARNAAIAQAKGRFIAFLDADDTWAPAKLARQIRFMEQTGAALSYTGYRRVNGRDQAIVRPPAQVTYAQLLRGNVIGCLTAIYDRHQLGTVTMPDFRRRQDFGLWLKILRQVGVAHGLPDPLATYHSRPGSLSSARFAAVCSAWQIYRREEHLACREAAYCIAQNLWQRARRRNWYRDPVCDHAARLPILASCTASASSKSS